MRRFVRDRFRAHMERRRRRREGRGWSVAGIAAGCALYFGGGLLIGFLLSPGWLLGGWIALGPLTVARVGYNQDPATA